VQREILSIIKSKKATTETPLTRLEFPTPLLKKLAEELSIRFGGRAEVYYSAGVSEGVNKINPTGKLQNQVSYVRKQLYEAGLLITSGRQRSTSVETTSTTKTSEANLKVLTNKNFTDWDAIKNAWKDTYSCKQQLRADKQDKLIEFSFFPCLANAAAVNLINDDFTSTFQNLTPLSDSWAQIRPALEEFVLSKRIDNINYSGSIHELFQLPDANKDALILELLLDAIKSTTLNSSKRRKIDETQPIDDKKKGYYGSEDNLDSEIKRRTDLITSPTEALDLAFKIFAITNCPFSKASWNVWLLIKKVVYKISSKEKSSVPLQKAITFIEQHLNLKIV
ncbi:Protein of unknown function, partial [Cotesia congregata]